MYSFQNDGCMTKSPAKWPMPSTLQAIFGQGLSFPPKKKFNGSSTMKGLWELLDHDTGTLDLGCFKGHCIFSSGGAVFFLVEWFPARIKEINGSVLYTVKSCVLVKKSKFSFFLYCGCFKTWKSPVHLLRAL